MAKSPGSAAESLRDKIDRAVEQGRRRRAKLEREKAKARANAGKYEPAIVSFIDVLGFQGLLSKRDPAEIHGLILSLREFTMPDELPVRKTKYARLTSRAFAESVSDAVVRVRPYNTQYADGAFFIELNDLLHVQIQCINSGVLIRAGIAIGDVHVGINGKGPVFGPAMVRAYRIESEEAIFPRIVIDEDAYKLFLSDRRLHNESHEPEEEERHVQRLIRVGEDGTRFIDYLSASETEFDDFSDYLAFLGLHAKLIRDNLAIDHRPTVKRKYVWLARYQNDIVRAIALEFERGERPSRNFVETFGCDPSKRLSTLLIDVE